MYLEELRRLESTPAPVAVIGIGRMGRGVVDQIATMPGLRATVLADVDPARAVEALLENGWQRDQICLTDSLGTATDALAGGRPVVTADANLVPELPVAAVVEATGVPEVGAEVAAAAITHKRHVVMLNVEADVVVGPILARRAREAGVVYTLAAGDQPGVIFELAEWAQTLGFRIVCAGRGTVLFPDDRHATPETYEEMAARNRLNPKMLCSFRDGTKSQTEMAAVSNVLQMPPAVRGMLEPNVAWPDLGRVFSLREQGGILDHEGVVDMANAVDAGGSYVHQDKVFPGIFVVVTSDHPGVRSAMGWLFEPGFGGTPPQLGPNWGLFRPYHLPCVETPMSVVRAIVQGRPTGDLRGGMVAELITVAKKDLAAGEDLDGAGGYTVYGLSEKYEVARDEGLLPLGFSYSGRTLRPIGRDQPIRWADVEIDRTGPLHELRMEQEKILG